MSTRSPLTKQSILNQLESSREQFLDALEGLSPDDMEMPGVAGVWSIKDILSHLSRWEAELVKLLFQARIGQKPTSAQMTVTQATLDALNQSWYNESRDRSLEHVLEDFHAVRNQTVLRVEEFPERDLLDPHRFSWSRNKSLSTWIENDTYGHEAEHVESILTWRKQRQS